VNKKYYDHLCACGCGGKIEIKSYHSKKGYKIPIYILGHHTKTNKHRNVLKDRMKGKPPWNKDKKCPQISKSRIGEKNPMYGRKGKDNPNFRRKVSDETRKKMSEQKIRDNNPGYWKGKSRSKETKKLISKKLKLLWKDKNSIYNSEIYKVKLLHCQLKRTINYINQTYPFFSKVEEMRYNPDKPGEKEIQVHCKNHNCPHSKEQDGWFTPTTRQIEARISALENSGVDLLYFYCSEKCKQECPLYYSRGTDPFKNIDKLYTYEEYNIWKETILEQDNYECQKCGSKENLHCHHIIPIKLEPLFALDPDNGIVLCKDCHYKYGHKTGTECSTGNLAKKLCLEINKVKERN